MPLKWKRVLILPAELAKAAPSAHVIEATPDDCGILRAMRTLQQGTKIVQVSHVVDPDSDDEARYPSWHEIHSALDELVPDGTVMQTQFPTGPEWREPHTDELTMIMVAVARLQPIIGGDGGNGKNR